MNEQIEIMDNNLVVSKLDDTIIEKLVTETIRDEGGKFVKGHSGNPLGRAVGSKNRATVLREKIDVALLDELVSDEEFIKVLEAMLLKAKGGDVQAAKLILKDIAGLRDDSRKSSGPQTVNVLIENYTKNEVKENG